jgi:hypothetical protein
MATTTATTSYPALTSHRTDSDRIEKEPRLTHGSSDISFSPELFEKLYLAPKTPHANDRVGKYANATPLGFLGYVSHSTPTLTILIASSFVISTFTFSMVLMGWGGASGLQAVV